MAKFKLTSLQKETLKFFSRNRFGQNFYWTGGTLLAYKYFDHRNSVDLDFFSENLYRDDEYLIFINELKKNLKAHKVIYTLKNNRRIYNIKKGREALKIELVYFPFPRIEKSKRVKDFGIKIDSLTNIMVNKTLSSYQRKEVKDIYDLYYYFSKKHKYKLTTLLKLVEKKFGVNIEGTLLLAKIEKNLENLDSIKPMLFSKISKSELRDFFQKEFDKLAERKIK